MHQDMDQIFEAIYEKEADAIFRFCLTRVSSREQALDITQETFMRLWQSISLNKPIENKKSFLFTVANHLIIDWYRKKKSQTFSDLERRGEMNEDFDVSDGMTEEKIILEEEGKFLLEKINELPPQYRDPLYLRYIEDLSPPEIAKILGISTNNASVKINRGIKELRKIAGYNIE